MTEETATTEPAATISGAASTEAASTVTGAAADPAPAPTKESLFEKIEAELEAIPHELVAKVKAALAALKAHL